ncbi:sugar phosphate isomerase/epimerase [soil metagenome]
MTDNELGIHAGVWVGDWTDGSARYAIESSASVGYDFIEIPAADPLTTDTSLTVRLLQQAGIAAVVSLALDDDSDINTDDPERSARGEARLTSAVDFASAIGADYVGGVTYSAMKKYDRAATTESRANSLAVLGRVAARAKASGIRLGIEYVNRYESNLLNTAAQTVVFIDELAADNVILHLDTFHANSEELSLPAAVHDAGSLLGYIHASESHRGLLGTGILDFDGFFAALGDAGYRGPVTFESFSSSVLPRSTSDTIGLWREGWSDPLVAATGAYEFLRSRVAALTALDPTPITATEGTP